MKRIELANQQNVAELANINILSVELSPSFTPTTFRVQIVLDTPGVFSLILTKTTVAVIHQFNSGVALAANAVYIFDHLVHHGDTVNYQTTVAGNVTLRIQEINDDI
jgi:hypothetical protein